MHSRLKRLGAAAILVAGASSVNLASAADNFSDRTLRGTWALFVQGHSGPATPPALPSETPLFAIATVTFDGAGGCESRDRIVIGNQDIPDADPNSPDGFREATDCTYAVEPDGTGSFTVTFQDAGPTVATFVIRNRRELFFIASNTVLGVYGGGTMKRR